MKKYEIRVTYRFNNQDEVQSIDYNWDSKESAEKARHYIYEHDKAVKDFNNNNGLSDAEKNMKYSNEPWYVQTVQTTNFDMLIQFEVDDGSVIKTFDAFWQVPPNSFISAEVIEHNIR